MLEIVMEELKKAATDFYNIAKMKIVLYDEDRHVLYSYPEKMCDFCTSVRNECKLEKKCIECDNISFDKCRESGKPYIYKCHMNLSEAIVPINENGITIGYLMLGQILLDEDEEELNNRIGIVAKKCGVNRDELILKASKIKRENRESLASAVSIMSMCACYLYVNKIIKNKSNMLSYQLKNYLDNHFTDDPTLAELCDKFFVSKSKLYTVAKKTFGMGVSDYIKMKKIEHAKRILLSTDKSVIKVAEEAGFSDYNYFIRIFKKHTGVTPKLYRNTEMTNR